MNKSNIEWCDYTWNPVTGCLHGCEYCYARRIVNRFGTKPKREAVLLSERELNEKPINPYPYGFQPTFHKYRLREPWDKTRSSKIFVCSMADLFGEWVPDEWIEETFKACSKAPQHKYLFLTKNPVRYQQINGWDNTYGWNVIQKNWWLGITITSQEDVKKLRQLPYGHVNTFVSMEPLKSDIDLSFYIPKATTQCKCSYCGYHADNYSSHCSNCNKIGGYSGSFRKHPINWVIIGAQTGPGAVPPKPEWVQSIIDQCRVANVPVFLKDNLNWHEEIKEYPEGLK